MWASGATADLLSIKVSVENSKEEWSAGGLQHFELSEPSDSSVVLIYATIDGTAINGEDYEANARRRGDQGRRAETARIEAPVIDDSER